MYGVRAPPGRIAGSATRCVHFGATPQWVVASSGAYHDQSERERSGRSRAAHHEAAGLLPADGTQGCQKAVTAWARRVRQGRVACHGLGLAAGAPAAPLILSMVDDGVASRRHPRQARPQRVQSQLARPGAEHTERGHARAQAAPGLSMMARTSSAVASRGSRRKSPSWRKASSSRRWKSSRSTSTVPNWRRCSVTN